MEVTISLWKESAKAVFRFLPFSVQVRLSRGNPDLAFYIDKIPREVEIDYFLGRYRLKVHPEVDLERRMLSGSYERDSMAVLKKLVRPGAICIDVGANVGALTIALADFSGTNGRVLAFEPGPNFASRLDINLGLNPELAKRISVHRVGLAEKAGELAWQMSEVYTGTASMYPGVHDNDRGTLRLPVVRLDQYAPVLELPRIDLLKIDVDGLEFEILQGAEALLTRSKPTIYVETTMWDEQQKKAAANIDAYLRSLGYKLYRIEDRTYDLHETAYPQLSFNSVAIHEDNSAPTR